jgi:uncharacterized protein (TIGR04141 family)
VSGKDSIHKNAKYNINNIDELIKILYEEYLKTTYKENFSFIDNVQLERDKKTIKALDAIVLEKLSGKEFETIVTAIPEIIEWENFDNIKFSHRADKKIENEKSIKRQDILVHDFFENFDENSYDTLFEAKIVLSKDDRPYREFNFKKCLIGEIEYDNTCYCLVNSNYYKTDKDYKNQVENNYANLPTASINYLIDCDCKENDYIKDLTQGDFLKLDSKLVYRGYKMEICDILEKDKIIHLKKYSSAAAISHFCKQARNSALLLKNDRKFVELANGVITNEIAKTPLILTDYRFAVNFDASRYSIIFGIISSDGTDKPNVSFFSKLNFVTTFQDLQNIGFVCALAGIKQI